jgi:ubiquinone/menaquinone biosynthesis C-methylase UbiE
MLDKTSEGPVMDEWNQKLDVMQYYSLTAKSYDELYAAEQRMKIEAALKRVSLTPNSLILDCGCGTGLLFEYVANKAQTIVGLDFSRGLLEEAKKKAKRFQNVHLILADADHTPLKDDIFSHVFAITLLQNLPNPERTLTELLRVSRNSAFLIITGLKRKFSLESFEALLHKLKLNIVEIICGDEALKCYVAVCIKRERKKCMLEA